MNQTGFNLKQSEKEPQNTKIQIRLFRYMGYAFFLLLLYFVFYLCFFIIPISGDFPMYLDQIVKHVPYSPSPHMASSFFFLSGIFYDALGFPVEFSLRIATLFLCILMIISFLGLQNNPGIFPSQYWNNKLGRLFLFMPALLIVFSPFFILLVEHSKQFTLISLLCFFLYLVFKGFSSNILFGDNGVFHLNLNSVVFSFLLLQIVTLIFLSSMMAFIYFFLLIAIMLSFSLHNTSPSKFLEKKRPFLAWLAILSSLASVESYVVAESLIKTTSPVHHTLNLFLITQGLENSPFLPSSEILLMIIPLALYGIVYFVPLLISKISEKIPGIRAKTMLGLQIGFILTFYVTWMFFALFGETPENTKLRSQFSFALIAIWVAWIAFQAILLWFMKTAVKQNELMTTMIVFAILLCFFIIIWSKFDTGGIRWSVTTIQLSRFAFFLIIPVSILGTIALSVLSVDISLVDIFRTFILPAPLILIGLIFFSGNPLNFPSIAFMYTLAINPSLFLRIFLIILIFLSTVKIPSKLSVKVPRSLSIMKFSLRSNLKVNFSALFQSQYFILTLIICQITGIFVMASLPPPLLTTDEETFIQEEIPKIIPKRARLHVQPHFAKWIQYYNPDSFFLIQWIWNERNTTLSNFLEKPTTEKINELQSYGKDFYVIISNSVRGRSFLTFDVEKIIPIQNENMELIYAQKEIYVIHFSFENTSPELIV